MNKKVKRAAAGTKLARAASSATKVSPAHKNTLDAGAMHVCVLKLPGPSFPYEVRRADTTASVCATTDNLARCLRGLRPPGRLRYAADSTDFVPVLRAFRSVRAMTPSLRSLGRGKHVKLRFSRSFADATNRTSGGFFLQRCRKLHLAGNP